MAGIDHTIIVFKNGRLMKETVQYRDEECVSLIPFSYNRDGQILGYEFGRGARFRPAGLRNRIAAFLDGGENSPEFFSYADKNVEIILCVYPDFNVTFYLDSRNTYVMLGGYGHYRNPYTHFYGRGYGEEFELKMAQECFAWLCTDILRDALETLPEYAKESDHHCSRLQLRLGYKSYWSMTEEERRDYQSISMRYYKPTKADDYEDADQLFPILVHNRA